MQSTFVHKNVTHIVFKYNLNGTVLENVASYIMT